VAQSRTIIQNFEAKPVACLYHANVDFSGVGSAVNTMSQGIFYKRLEH
jgi:hypothetical protein